MDNPGLVYHQTDGRPTLPGYCFRANALKILCKQVAKMASLCFSRGKPDGRQFCGTFFGVEGFTV
ncbi:MAG: hypothetical protein ACYCTY_16175, partial [Sulfuricella sp.]